MLAVMKISLIALGVSDLSKSVAFYRDKAGFDLQNQFESFAFFPAGLVLYWVTNTILSIAQQWNINRRIAAAAAKKN